MTKISFYLILHTVHPWQRVHFHFHRRPWRCRRWMSSPMDIPWEGWPRPCPLPLAHFFIHLTFFSPLTHPHLKGTCPHLICKWSQHEPDILTSLYWCNTLESVVCPSLLVCFCVHRLQLSASVCEDVSQWGSTVWPRLISHCKTPNCHKNTISSIHVEFMHSSGSQTQWDFVFVASPVRVLGMRCSLLQYTGRTFIFFLRW